MFDDLFESIDFGVSASKKLQIIIRIFFGFIGVFLAGAGIWKMLFDYPEAGLPLRMAFAALMFFMGAIFGVNVALHKRVAWPFKGFALAFVGMFLVRFIFGP